MSCDPSKNGFTTQYDYVRDQAGHQLSEFVPGATPWQHTNVYANGELFATQDQTGTHFYLNDWLGTRRVQTDSTGTTIEQTCSSLPYGDGESCQPTPTENLFTGKVRDSESGLDYFGARYYGSGIGRFLSPDPSGLYFADPNNPQSFNLYSYAYNNPLIGIDGRFSYGLGARGGTSATAAFRVGFVPHYNPLRPYFQIGGGVVSSAGGDPI